MRPSPAARCAPRWTRGNSTTIDGGITRSCATSAKNRPRDSRIACAARASRSARTATATGRNASSIARMKASLAPALRRYAELDKRLVKAVRDIRVLDMVAWPAVVEQRFLADLQRGRETLPRFEYRPPDFFVQRADLLEIAAAADVSHPLG